MKKTGTKKLTAWLLVFCMIFGMMSQFTMQVQAAENDLNLKWPSDMSIFPEWVKYGTQEVRDGLISAINEEYDRQTKAGFNMGDISAFGLWEGQVTAQFNGGDNVGNPWEDKQPGRKWGKIVAPYEGMAFSVVQYMSQNGSDLVPLANQIEWTDPKSNKTKIYQVFYSSEKFFDTDGNNGSGWGYHPGSNVSGNCVDAFRQAYAQSAWYNESMGKPYNLGCIMSNAKKEGQIVYQECLGNDSDGRSPENGKGYEYDYGISYLVSANTASTEAFIITDKMFTAWTTTWKNNNEKFANSGVPLGNQYVNAQGKIAQDFENFTLVLNDDVYKPTKLMAKADLSNFRVNGGETLQNGNDIVVFVQNGVHDIKNLVANFDLSEGAIADKASGTAQDFSETVVYTTTAQTGTKYTYNVSVVAIDENAITEEQRDTAKSYITKFRLLNNPVTLGDADTITYLESEFWKLDNTVKYLVKENYKSLVTVTGELNELSAKTDALKVSCVGDSITELSPNYVVPLRDLFDSKRVSFHEFGKSGFCLCKAGDWSYWTTDDYTKSKELQPNIVTIMLGTNDSKPRNWNDRGCKNTMKSDLAELIDIYRNLDSHPEVIILTSPTVYDKEFKAVDTINNDTVKLIGDIQREVAKEKGCPLVDIYALTQNDPATTRDGVHPSDKGTKIMAEAIADAINTYLIGTGISKLTVGGKEQEVGQQYYQVELEEGQAFPDVVLETVNGGGNVTKEHVPTKSEPYYIFKVTSKIGGYAKKYMVEFTGGNLNAEVVTNPYGSLVIEAEDGVLTGGAAPVENNGASGKLHVGTIGGPTNGTTTIEVNAKKAAEYTLNIYYAQLDTRSIKVTVNNVEVGTVQCDNTGEWNAVGATPVTMKVQLVEGKNTIAIGGAGNGAYAPNIDKIELVGHADPGEEPDQDVDISDEEQNPGDDDNNSNEEQNPDDEQNPDADKKPADGEQDSDDENTGGNNNGSNGGVAGGTNGGSDGTAGGNNNGSSVGSNDDETTGGTNNGSDDETTGDNNNGSEDNEATGGNGNGSGNNETTGGNTSGNGDDETTGGNGSGDDETTGGNGSGDDETTGGNGSGDDETTGGNGSGDDETIGGNTNGNGDDETTGGNGNGDNETTGGNGNGSGDDETIGDNGSGDKNTGGNNNGSSGNVTNGGDSNGSNTAGTESGTNNGSNAGGTTSGTNNGSNTDGTSGGANNGNNSEGTAGGMNNGSNNNEVTDGNNNGSNGDVTIEGNNNGTSGEDNNGNNAGGANNGGVSGGNNNGETANGAGSAGATGDNGNNGASVSTVKVTGIQLTGISKRIAVDKKIQLTAIVSPANATSKAIIWTVDNENYASVDQNGLVKVKKAGQNKSVTVTATAADGSGITATYQIKIMPKAVKKITLLSKKTVKAGASVKITAIVSPLTGTKKINKTLNWTSNNEKFATVNKNGVVKTKKAGKGKNVKITAKATDGSNKQKSITIKIR